MNIDNYTKIPVKDVISYKGKGVVQIYENYYWIIYKENILIHKNGGEMCNSDKRIIDQFIHSIFKDGLEFSIIQLPVAFIGWEN